MAYQSNEEERATGTSFCAEAGEVLLDMLDPLPGLGCFAEGRDA